MNRKTSLLRSPLALALPLALMAIPALAQSTSIPHGDDGWVTQGGGLTTIDLSSFPVSSVFPGGSITGSSVVNLKGSPLDSTNLGSIDTLVSRTTDLSLATGGSGDVNITVRAISMVSDASTVTISGHGTYSLGVALSPTAVSSGTMHVTLSNTNGGTFTSSFDVIPKLTFTNVSNPSDVVTLDCGVTHGCSSLSLSSTGTGWARASGLSGGFSATTAGVTPIRSGVTVNGYTTVGNSNFYPGFSSVSPYPTAPGSHSALTASHSTTPPRDCQSGTRTGTGLSRSVTPLAFQRLCPNSVTFTTN